MRIAFRVISLLAVCACRKERIEAEHDAAAVAVVSASASVEAPAPSASAAPLATASASASASASPPARIPCGTKTCAATQFCVHESKGQGITPPPGQNAFQSTSVECRNSIPTGGYSCGPVGKNREVSCVAMIPAAPPRGGPF